MTGFEPGISRVGSNHSTNCATTAAPLDVSYSILTFAVRFIPIFVLKQRPSLEGIEIPGAEMKKNNSILK